MQYQNESKIYKKKIKQPIYPNNEYNYRTVFICSKQGSGKSTLSHHLCEKLADVNETQIFFFSSVKTDQEKYKDFNVSYYDQDFIDNPKKMEELYDYMYQHKDKKYKEIIVESQNKFFKEKKLVLVDEPFKKNKCQFIVIFDDIDFPKQSLRIIKRMFRCYRHTNTLFILTSQTCMIVLDKKYRELFNCLIFFQNINIDRIKNVIYPMLPDFMSFDQFRSIYQDATQEKYHFLLIDTFDQPIFQQDFNYQYIIEKNQGHNNQIQIFKQKEKEKDKDKKK